MEEINRSPAKTQRGNLHGSGRFRFFFLFDKTHLKPGSLRPFRISCYRERIGSLFAARKIYIRGDKREGKEDKRASKADSVRQFLGLGWKSRVSRRVIEAEWRNKYPSDGPGVKKMDQLGVADKIERRRRVRLIYSPIHGILLIRS